VTSQALAVSGVTIQTLTVTSSYTVPSGGVTVVNLVLAGGEIDGPGTLTVPAAGTVTVTSSGARLGAGVRLLNQGQMTIPQSTVRLSGSSTLENQGSLTLQAGGSVVSADISANVLENDQGATIDYSGAAGQIATVGVPLVNQGTVNVAGGMLAVADLTLQSSGTLAIGIGSDQAYGSINSSGTTDLGGTLATVTASGFVPAMGQQFQVLTASTLNGTFDSLTGNTLSDRQYQDSYRRRVVLLTVVPAITAPVITSANQATFAVGTPGNFMVTATGEPTPTMTESGALPPGVRFRSRLGSAMLSGSPQQGSGGVYAITITASNGVAATQAFTLTIDEGVTITSSSSASFSTGQANSFTVVASGYPTPTFTETGALPAGVSLSSSGLLSSTAALSATGTYPIVITASNNPQAENRPQSRVVVQRGETLTAIAADQYGNPNDWTAIWAANRHRLEPDGQFFEDPSLIQPGWRLILPHLSAADHSAARASQTSSDNRVHRAVGESTQAPGVTQSFVLNVGTAPSITSAPSAGFAVRQPNSFTVTAAGTTPVSFSETGLLPDGVSFSPSGVLAGSPTPNSAASYPITITASNGYSPDATQSFTLVVGTRPMITSAWTTTFTTGAPGSFAVTATGIAPIRFSETGPLPAGVTLSSSGALSGTPAEGTGGNYPITIIASNGYLQDATQNFTLVVDEVPVFTSANTTTFQAGTSGSFQVTVEAFPARVSFRINTGDLPAGVDLSRTGLLSGIPAPGTGGTYPLTIEARSSLGVVSQDFTLTIDEAPSITGPDNTDFTVGAPGSFSIQAAGTPAPTFSETGALPSGVTLSSAGVLAGTPARGTDGSYPITVVAANGIAPDASQSFTLTVNPAPGGPASVPSGPIVSSGPVGAGQVNPVSGSYTTSVPIIVPPYHGIEPHLSLTYDSNGADGWVGKGWSLSGLSYITRQSAAFGAPHYDTSDVFNLDGEQLVPCGPTQVLPASIAPSCRYPTPPSGTTYYTTRREADLVITRTVSSSDPAAGTWTVTDKSGTVYTYKPDFPFGPGTVPDRFHLASVADLRGNLVTYDYTAPQAGLEPTLADITYNGVTIDFYSESRPDPVSRGVGGGMVRLSTRLRTIDVLVGTARARVYGLSYVSGSDDGDSILLSVSTFGTDATVAPSGSTTVPPGTITGTPVSTDTFTANGGLPLAQSMGWQPSISTPVTASPSYASNAGISTSTLGLPQDTVVGGSQMQVGHLDTSGRLGAVIISPCPPEPGSAFCRAHVTSVPWVGASSFSQFQLFDSGDVKQWWLTDINGDGLDDLVFLRWDPYAHMYILNWIPNTGKGFGPDSNWSTGYEFGEKYTDSSGSHLTCEAGDVDGSGHSSLVCIYNLDNSKAGYPAGPPTIVTLRWTPTGWSASPLTSFFPDPPGVEPQAAQSVSFQLADVNGDGRLDVVKFDNAGSCLQGFQVALAGGSGWLPPVFTPVPPAFCPPAASGDAYKLEAMRVGDVRGDGRAGLVGLFASVNSSGTQDGLDTVSFLSNGDGTFGSPVPRPIPSPLLQIFGGNFTDGVMGLSTGNVDGSGVDGLMLTVAVPADPATYNYSHLEVIRASSNGDGSFTFPGNLSTPVKTEEVPVPTPGFVLPLNFGTLFFPGPEPSTQSAYGNGMLDFVAFDQTTASGRIVVAPTPQTETAQTDWQPATIGASAGYLAIQPDTIAPVVRTLTPTAYAQYPLNTVTTTGDSTGQPIDLSLKRNWFPIQTGRNQPSLVYVGPTNVYTGPQGPGFPVLTYQPTPGAGWESTPVVTWLPNPNFNATTNWIGDWFPADVNGDGTSSALVRLAYDSAAQQLQVFTLLPNPDGTWSEQNSPIPAGSIGPDDDGMWRVASATGDSRADLVHVSVDGTRLTIDTLISDGNGQWTPVSQPFTGAANLDNNAANWLVGDVNGDGMADLVHVDTSVSPNVTQSFISLGSPGLTGNQWQGPIPGSVSPRSPGSPWSLFDANLDGRVDLVQITPQSYFPGSSISQITAAAGRGDGTFEAADLQGARIFSAPASSSYRWLVDDIDQDGTPDIVQITATGSGFTATFEPGWDLNDGRILGVSNSIGGQTQISYGTTGGAGCVVPPRFLSSTVAATVTTAGPNLTAPGATTTSYTHWCTIWSSQYHDSLGFTETQATQAPTASQPTGSRMRSYFALSENCGVQPIEVLQGGASGPWVSVTDTSYDQAQGNGPSYFCLPTEVRKRGPSPSKGLLPPEATTRYQYDSYGNVRTQDDSESTTAPVRTTQTTFNYSLTPYLVDLPSSITVSDTSGPLQETQYCYDGSCSGLPPNPQGLLTEIEPIDLSTNSPAETESYTYDSAGNLRTTTDSLDHKTTLSYDPVLNIYPSSVTNPEDQKTTIKWDTTLGEVLSTKDPDNVTTSYGYDQFGRLTGLSIPGQAATTYSYDNFGIPGFEGVSAIVRDGSRDGIWTAERFDGLGRVYLVAKKAVTAGTADVALTYYDDASGNPYHQTNWGVVPAPGVRTKVPAVPEDTFAYDALGRPVELTDGAGNKVAISYGILTSETLGEQTTTVTDQSGNTGVTVTDPWGRTVQESQGSSTLSLGYDDLNRLVSSTDPNELTTTQTWNSLSQLTSEASPDRGTWHYTYDPVGNLYTSTDALGQTDTYGHDALGRLTTETLPDGSQLSWNYDQPGHGAAIGQLTSIADTLSSCPGGVEKSFSYDSNERLSAEQDCVAGQSQTTSVSYDSAGRVNAVIYPDGENVSQTYDAAGRLSSVGSYVTSATYDPSGALSSLTLGDGSTRQYTYDWHGRGWLTQLQDQSASGTNLINSTYAYHPNGQLASESTTLGGPAPSASSASYTYDALNRLTVVTGTNAATTSYDAAGNIQSTSTAGGYSYQSSGCSQTPCNTQKVASTTNGSGTTTYSYDPNGNLRSEQGPAPGGTETFSWNANQQLVNISQTGSTSSNVALSYAADGSLSEQNQTGSSGERDIRYFNPFIETDSQTGTVKNYLFDGTVIAQSANGSLTYLHDDRLGSPQVLTNVNGSPTSTITYDSRGARTGTAAPTIPGFTGAPYIAGTSLVHLGARNYDTILGRFISADSLALAGTSSQAANRYAYAANDPVNTVDPTGHQGCDDSDPQCIGWSPTEPGGGSGGGSGSGGGGSSGGGNQHPYPTAQPPVYNYAPPPASTVSQPSSPMSSFSSALTNAWNGATPGQKIATVAAGVGIGLGIAVLAVPALGGLGLGLAASITTAAPAWFWPVTLAVTAGLAGAGSIRTGTTTAAEDTALTAAQNEAAALRAAKAAGELEGRLPTATAAAVDRTTGEVVGIGHSGDLAGPPAGLEDVLPKPSLEPWPAWNCAEVAACGAALEGGSSLENLVVRAVRTLSGDPFPPCDNCQVWLPGGGG
jgi:RHS repeat-associated protein